MRGDPTLIPRSAFPDRGFRTRIRLQRVRIVPGEKVLQTGCVRTEAALPLYGSTGLSHEEQ
jgi:hypothetical protein